MKNSLVRSSIHDMFPSISTAFWDEFDRVVSSDVFALAKQSYPPYNIVKVDENEYTVEVALAGFSKEDISIETENNVLTIKGSKNTETDETVYLVKNIANRKFSLSFSLGEYIEASRAEMEDGMLYVDLKRFVPEAKRPKRLTVN